jgi:hypothetical protein
LILILNFRENIFGTLWPLLRFTVITLFVNDNFVRPYVGDLLVVILIYCSIKSFFQVSILLPVIGVLVFSFIIETLQYVKIVEKLGLEKSQFARTVIGTSFAWGDILAYIVGIAIVLSVEKYLLRKNIL